MVRLPNVNPVRYELVVVGAEGASELTSAIADVAPSDLRWTGEDVLTFRQFDDVESPARNVSLQRQDGRLRIAEMAPAVRDVSRAVGAGAPWRGPSGPVPASGPSACSAPAMATRRVGKSTRWRLSQPRSHTMATPVFAITT